MMTEDTGLQRRAMFGVLGGAAALGLSAAAEAAPAGKPAPAGKATEPRQGWATQDGAIRLLAPGKIRSTYDPLSYILIHEAFSRFGIAHDEVQGEILHALFTDDALVQTAKGHGEPFQQIHGRQAIVSNFLNVLSQQRDQRRHCMTNVLIQDLTQETASAIAYGVVTTAADGLRIGASVFYSADLRRAEAGHWRFTRLYIGMDDYAGQPPKV
jgi:hypothetical protein